jgi:hypothetical protein
MKASDFGDQVVRAVSEDGERDKRSESERERDRERVRSCITRLLLTEDGVVAGDRVRAIQMAGEGGRGVVVPLLLEGLGARSCDLRERSARFAVHGVDRQLDVALEGRLADVEPRVRVAAALACGKGGAALVALSAAAAAWCQFGWPDDLLDDEMAHLLAEWVRDELSTVEDVRHAWQVMLARAPSSFLRQVVAASGYSADQVGAALIADAPSVDIVWPRNEAISQKVLLLRAAARALGINEDEMELRFLATLRAVPRAHESVEAAAVVLDAATSRRTPLAPSLIAQLVAPTTPVSLRATLFLGLLRMSPPLSMLARLTSVAVHMRTAARNFHPVALLLATVPRTAHRIQLLRATIAWSHGCNEAGGKGLTPDELLLVFGASEHTRALLAEPTGPGAGRVTGRRKRSALLDAEGTADAEDGGPSASEMVIGCSPTIARGQALREVQLAAASLGAVLVDPAAGGLTHLLTSGNVTLRAVCALVSGISVMSVDYLLRSARRQRLLPAASGLVSGRRELLFGRRIHIRTLSSQAERAQAKLVVEASGNGELVDSPADAQNSFDTFLALIAWIRRRVGV